MAFADTALRALAWVAPRAAMARVHALGQLAEVRAYDGATLGRRADSFKDRGSSANVEIGAALSRLRNRSSDLVRNTSAGRRVLDVKAAHAIGTGITIVPDNGSDRVDNLVKQELADWIPTADIEGVCDFNGLQRIAYMAMHERGDSVIRRVPRRLGTGQRVPLKLQVLEGDYLDTFRDRAVFDGHVSRLGVTLGDWNARTGYWLHPDHPGELNYRGTAYVSKFVAASEVIHLFCPLRPGQIRGVPIFAPVLMSARDLADLMEAVLVKARTEACFSAFVTREGSAPQSLGTAVKENGPGLVRRVIEKIAPGMVNYLEPGEKVEFAEPTGSGQFESIHLAGQMAFAAGTGITHDQLTGDLRQANYSSLRAGTITQRRLTEQEQHLVLEPQMMRRVMGWWTDAALTAGVLRPRKGGYRFRYVMPAVEPIDPRKDLEADILAVRSGRMTPQDFIGSWGADWRKALDDTEAFLKALDVKGMVLDIDPRRTSQLGVAQLPPGETNPTDPPKAA